MDELIYNCLIVDDEPIAVRVIKNHLSEFKNLRLAGECNNAVEAIQVLSKTKIDLIFLDIQMPQITGLELLKTLNHPPKVILVTAYRDYAIEAFDLDVVDYLLKPVSLLRFSKALSRFFQRMNEAAEPPPGLATKNIPEHLFLKADKKFHKVLLTEILFVESLGDYVAVHCESGKIVSKQRISQLEEVLPPERFIRVHRGFIVSIAKIKAVIPGQLEIGSKKIPIGRNYKSSVEKLVKTNL